MLYCKDSGDCILFHMTNKFECCIKKLEQGRHFDFNPCEHWDVRRCDVLMLVSYLSNIAMLIYNKT